MKQFTYTFALCILLTLISIAARSQTFSPPMQIPPSLSANFGELRNNHFHSGLDYRTQLKVNIPVYAIGDGYVSRINVSPAGFGLALYISHPSGQTSVYGHLNSFSKKIADYIRAKQYEKETYRIDVSLKEGEIPVKKGEQIALSGNSGSSGGPHLHFEIRDTRTEEPLDVLDFLGYAIRDTLKPEIRGIAFYPQIGKGVVNGGTNPVRLTISSTSHHTPAKPEKPVTAWGRIGVGVKADDRMNGTTNTFGVKYIRLFVDDVRVFSSTMDRYSFDKTRMINSFIDFDDWRTNKSFYMKSFVEPGNTLPIYETMNNGYIDINFERDYKLRYELEDNYGNRFSYSFVVKGVKQSVPQPAKCPNVMAWNISNNYYDTDFSLTIPTGNLFTDFCYTHSKTTSGKYFSDIHQVNNKPIPLIRGAQIRILLKAGSKADISKLGIVEIAKTGQEEWVGGTFKAGGLEAAITELGKRYAIGMDTVAPKITPVNPEKWVTNKRIAVSVSDEKSGIAKMRGEIDGKFALFTNDVKSNIHYYAFDDERLVKNTPHKLVVTAVDQAGNRTEYRYEFVY